MVMVIVGHIQPSLLPTRGKDMALHLSLRCRFPTLKQIYRFTFIPYASQNDSSLGKANYFATTIKGVDPVQSQSTSTSIVQSTSTSAASVSTSTSASIVADSQSKSTSASESASAEGLN